jgi:glycosyltransferase involved in cell wall biosynthesis
MQDRGAGRLSRTYRIAFIGTRGVPAGEGGVERHVEELGARLAERGHEVTVYCRTNYVKERPPSYRGMRLRYVPSASTKNLDFIAHSAASSVLVLRRPPDIIHFHAIGSALVAPLPRYLTRSKIVLTVHGLDYARDKWTGVGRAALKVAEGLSARVPHATIAVSRSLADHYATKLGRKADYIPNGVPEGTIRPLGSIGGRLGLQGRPYFLFVGRLVPEKAPDLLVRALAQVKGDVRLVIAGSSCFTDAYADSVRRLAASDPRAILAGGVFGADLSELYSNAAAFVLPSSLEGLPLTLLEAIAHRAPVIVSDIPPHLEIVGEDGLGHHVVPQGSVDALSAAMAAVLLHNDREKEGAAALSGRVAQEYSWEAITTATERVYARLLERSASKLAPQDSPGSELPV